MVPHRDQFGRFSVEVKKRWIDDNITPVYDNGYIHELLYDDDGITGDTRYLRFKKVCQASIDGDLIRLQTHLNVMPPFYKTQAVQQVMVLAAGKGHTPIVKYLMENEKIYWTCYKMAYDRAVVHERTDVLELITPSLIAQSFVATVWSNVRSLNDDFWNNP